MRVKGTRDGILLDLSEGGALVLFATALPIDKQITLQIDWDGGVLQVDGRVKRCLSRQVQLPSATLARTQYDVALEFVGLTPDAVAGIRTILQKNSGDAA